MGKNIVILQQKCCEIDSSNPFPQADVSLVRLLKLCLPVCQSGYRWIHLGTFVSVAG